MHISILPLSIALSLVSPLFVANAQDNGGGSNGDFLQQYLTFLNSSGYTSLSGAIQQVQQSGNGGDWLDRLSSGNWTAFVPNNQAFSSLPADVSNDTDALSNYLSYHYVHGSAARSNSSSSGSGSASKCSSSGSVSATSTGGGESSSQAPGAASAYRLLKTFLNPHSFATNGSGLDCSSAVYPNATIGRTLLTDDDYVQLEGDVNRGQVLAWSRFSDGSVHILNQPSNTTVSNTTQFQHILLADIDSVLIPPGNLTVSLTAVNDTLLLNLLSTVQVPTDDGNSSAIDALESLQGFTFFAPNSDAFTSEVNNTLQSLQNNQTALVTLLQNHYANGTTRYSPSLLALSSDGNGSSLVSAAGEPFTFSSNDTGLYVSNGNGSSAQIVRPNVLVENGVIHIIDRFLLNEEADPEAASSAVASASSAATETASDTAILGGATASGSSSPESQAPSSGGASSTSAVSSSSTSAVPSSGNLSRFRRNI